MINPHQSIFSLSPLSPTLPPLSSVGSSIAVWISINQPPSHPPTNNVLVFLLLLQIFPTQRCVQRQSPPQLNCLVLSFDLHPTINSAVKTTHRCVSLCNAHSSLSSIQTSFHRYSKESSSSQHNLPIYLL